MYVVNANKKKFLVIILLSLMIFSSCAAAKSDYTILTQKGLIDATKVDFGQKIFLPLYGQWEFYNKKLLSPKDFQSENFSPQYIDVNKKNNSFNYNGYATYKIKLKLVPEQKIYCLDFKYSASENYKIWIDGSSVSSYGNPSKVNYERPLKRDVLLRKFIYFSPKNINTDIVIQISSNRVKKFNLLILTTLENANSRKDQKDIILFVITGFLISMGLYHIILYFFRKKDKQKLFLGLAGFFGIGVVFVGNCRIGETYTNLEINFSNYIIKEFSPYIFIMIHNFMALTGVILLSLSVYFFYLPKISRRAIIFYYLVSITYILFFITALIDFERIGFYFYLLNLAALFFSLLSSIYYSIRGFIKNPKFDNLFFVIGIVVYVITAINDVLIYSGLESVAIVAYGIVMLFLAESFIIAYNSINAFKKIEVYSSELSEIYSKLKIVIGKSQDSSIETDISINELYKMIAHIMQANKKIVKAIESVSQGAIAQSKISRDGILAVEKLSMNSEEIIQNAAKLKNSSINLVNVSGQGNELIIDLSNMHEKNNQIMTLMNEVVENLVEKINTISEFSRIIVSISKETKHLALNVSIEAAKAKDSGKGFSVIAQSIRNLALQTDARAQEIQRTVSSLMEVSEITLKELGTSNELFNAQGFIVKNTIKIFKEFKDIVLDSIEQINYMNGKIVQLKKVRDTVSETMIELSKTAESNSLITEEVSAITQEQYSEVELIHTHAEKLKSESENLKLLISSLNRWQ